MTDRLGALSVAVLLACALVWACTTLPANAEGPDALYLAWERESALNGTEVSPMAYARHQARLGDPRPLIRATWPDWAEGQALAVANCESHFYPRAINPSSGASGLFQIIRLYHEHRVYKLGYPTWSMILDPVVNIEVAFDIWRETQAFQPHWNASIGCWGGGRNW